MPAKKQKSYNFPKHINNPELIGHRAIAKSFCDAFDARDEHPIHPVWILSGTRGIGKANLAYHLARYVFKVSGTRDQGPDLFGAPEPLMPDSCSSFPVGEADAVFQKMQSGGFGELIVVDLENNKSDSGALIERKRITRDTLRAMIERLQLKSVGGEWRVIIIDSLDELSDKSPNSILKILEEPPERTIFFLIAHSLANVLPTILSRARVEKLSPLNSSELRDLFYKFLPDEEISPALLRLANGSFGRIADLKLSGGDVVYEKLLNVCENPNANAADIMAVAESIAEDVSLHGLIMDAVAHYGLADLYPVTAREIANISRIHLCPKIGIFNLINKIKKCL